MKELHCPNCGTAFVRVTYHEGTVERVLHRFNVFPFRCQLCTNRFRAFSAGARHSTQAFDRRQYKRLPTSLQAQLFTEHSQGATNQIIDISMDGCTVQSLARFPRGTFLELVVKPSAEGEAIRIETAMVCSVRPTTIGIRFLEVPPADRQRLSQVVLGLLVSQWAPPTLNA